MQRLEVSGAVRLIYKSLGVKGLIMLYELVARRNVQNPLISSSYICAVFIIYLYRIFHFPRTKVQSQIF